MSYMPPKSEPAAPKKPVDIVLTAVAIGLVAILLLGLVVGGCTGVKAWQRSQRRADANNKVAITHILIRNAQQQARIVYAEIAATRAEAQKRFQEAVGIRRAQDEISRTLTPFYLQHEAIQALDNIATSGQNNTVVYVPSGANGVPLVQNALQPTSPALSGGGRGSK